MREKDAHQKLKIKTQAESRKATKESDIQVGDTVLVKQSKHKKLSTPYHPVPLTVTQNNHSMITAENDDRKVTRNSSNFKKFLTDESSSNGALEDDGTYMDMQSSPPVPIPVPRPEGADPVLLDPGETAVTAPIPSRSTRVSVPPKRLIQEI